MDALVIYRDKQAKRLYISKLICFNQSEPSQTMISRKKHSPCSTDGQYNCFIGCHSLKFTLMHFDSDAPAGPDSFHVEADEEEWESFLSSRWINKKKNEVD